MISYYTPTSNNFVVAPNDVNTQAGTVRADYPTHEEELALLVYEEEFRQPELAKFLASAKSREGEIWEEEESRAKDRAVITPAVWSFEDELERREMSDLPNAQDHAINSALSKGFVVDESTDCYTVGCSCSRHQA
tara:strand:+ start:332 stop:736 length:405 start_codon:yes stop_codon:yes gene_type:complete